jgi:hypothetical protein
MSDPDIQAHPGEVVVSPDPLALAKRAVGEVWRYALALVVILAVLGGVFRQSLSWGDVATWVVAITTLLAFLAAAFAGMVAYDLLRVENARDLKAAQERLLAADDRKRADAGRAAQREADRRAQASKVTAWFERFRHPERPSQMENATTWGAAIQNASDLPVLDVRVFFYWVNRTRDGSPWTTELRYASVERILVIPPGKTRYVELPARVRDMAEECNDEVYLVGIEFTDANGIRWRRDERAALHDAGA